MLEVQKYLHEHSFDELKEELGIKATFHDTDPLVILNYSQIDSPKTNAIVRECRGLVLNSQTYDVVAKGFPRFFNWGELQDEMVKFDFSNFTTLSKEDGSLVLFYHFDGKWRVNTRGSFAQQKMEFSTVTWEQAICSALDIRNLSELEDLGWSEDTTYVGEFCSPMNKVVRKYESCVYLLSAFDRNTLEEFSPEYCDSHANYQVLRPKMYHFSSTDEIEDYLIDQMAEDPTFEGVVIRDVNGLRYKLKSPSYLGLHRLKGEDNFFNPKHLIPFVIGGEEAELFLHFPESSETFYKVKSRILEHYSKLLEVWGENWQIGAQKEFAIKIGKVPFSGLLFQLRSKHGRNQKASHLREMWNSIKNQDQIFKNLFKGKPL